MRTGRPRWAVLVIGLSVVLGSGVAGCAQSASPPEPAPTQGQPAPPSTHGEPGAAPTPGASAPKASPSPAPETLADYSRRCRKANQEGQLADVAFQPQAEMTRGETGTVALAVTLARDVPPADVLGQPGASEEKGLLVACVLQARLLAPTGQFTVDAEGRDWQSRSLETQDTAEWLWQLTPRLSGSYAVSVELRPVVRIADIDGTSRERALRKANIRTYKTTVHVVLPPAERPAWWMRWAKGRVDDATNLLQSLAVLVGAAGGLWFALRHFNKPRADDEDAGVQQG